MLCDSHMTGLVASILAGCHYNNCTGLANLDRHVCLSVYLYTFKTTVTHTEAERGWRFFGFDFFKKKTETFEEFKWSQLAKKKKKKQSTGLCTAPTPGRRAHLLPDSILYGFTYLKYSLYSQFLIPSSGYLGLFCMTFLPARASCT